MSGSGSGDAADAGKSAVGGETASGGKGAAEIASGGKLTGSGGTSGAGATPGMGGHAQGGAVGSGGKTATTAGAGGASAGNASTGSGGGLTGGTSSSAGASPVGTMTVPGMGCTPPAAYANLFVSVSGHTQAESDAKVAAAWTALFTPSGKGSIYYNGPGADESYVQDTYNNDVRTEGMSYGMMVAVQLNHQTEFDRLWQFVTKHMAQGTGQIAWHVSTSGGKLATGGAPDGDEYFAAALVFAHKRWGDTSGKFNYGKEAQWGARLDSD